MNHFVITACVLIVTVCSAAVQGRKSPLGQQMFGRMQDMMHGRQMPSLFERPQSMPKQQGPGMTGDRQRMMEIRPGMMGGVEGMMEGMMRDREGMMRDREGMMEDPKGMMESKKNMMDGRKGMMKERFGMMEGHQEEEERRREKDGRRGDGVTRVPGEDRAIDEETLTKIREFYMLVSTACEAAEPSGAWTDVCAFLADNQPDFGGRDGGEGSTASPDAVTTRKDVDVPTRIVPDVTPRILP